MQGQSVVLVDASEANMPAYFAARWGVQTGGVSWPVADREIYGSGRQMSGREGRDCKLQIEKCKLQIGDTTQVGVVKSRLRAASGRRSPKNGPDPGLCGRVDF
jgi:hypothetical protein